jgi:DNA-binding transcriptional MerR regulator
MHIDTKNLLNSIMESFDRISYVKSSDIPNIDLYMDQVTTFMDKNFRKTTRYPGDDKVMTKTMINNYAKNDLLPPPIRKKYSREHILVLIFIYYYKGILSISDIQTLLGPITEKFFHKEEAFDIQSVYEEVFQVGYDQIEALKQHVIAEYDCAMGTFEDAPEENREFLKLFSFICFLSFDVYMKKQLIEKLIDEIKADGFRTGPKDENKK